MKQTIRDVLSDMSESQINLASEAARNMVTDLISAALKTKGTYTEYGDDEIEEQKARATWVCSICGENTADVDYDYLGSGTNHLGCELKSQEEIDEYVEDIDEQAYAQGRKSSVNEEDDSDYYTGPEPRVVDDAGVDIETGKYVGGGSEEIDGAYTPDEYEEWENAVKNTKYFGYVEPDSRTDGSDGYSRSEPYEGQEKAIEDMPEGLIRAKQLAQEAIEEGIKQKLSEEIVDSKDKDYIYESPDGGKTIFKRKVGDDKRELVENWNEVKNNER